ncbi:MAG: TIGR03089 family protein [Ancrocorticia sp.]
MTDALSLYRSLAARGTQPALTWYGEQGRMELSGKVAANHLAKIAGYLADELWLDPGAAVELDLPAHWKQLLWGLGAMLAGLEVRVESSRTTTPRPLSDEPAQAIITSRPEKHDPEASPAESIAALDLGPLALRWMGDPLSPGVYDASAEVMGQPDSLMDDSRSASSNFAHWHGLGTLDCGDDHPRILITRTEGVLDPAVVLAVAARQLGRGSLVVVDMENTGQITQIEGALGAQFVSN